jgi:hypothetical protein
MIINQNVNVKGTIKNKIKSVYMNIRCIKILDEQIENIGLIENI